jgi:hypothetical protein
MAILDHAVSFDLFVLEVRVLDVESGVVFEVSEAQLHKLLQERIFF